MTWHGGCSQTGGGARTWTSFSFLFCSAAAKGTQQDRASTKRLVRPGSQLSCTGREKQGLGLGATIEAADQRREMPPLPATAQLVFRRILPMCKHNPPCNLFATLGWVEKLSLHIFLTLPSRASRLPPTPHSSPAFCCVSLRYSNTSTFPTKPRRKWTTET